MDNVPHGHWKTTTFVAALRHDSLTAPMVVDGAINGELFLERIQNWSGAKQYEISELKLADNVPRKWADMVE